MLGVFRLSAKEPKYGPTFHKELKEARISQ